MSRTTKQKAMSRTAAVSLPDPEQPTTAMQSGTVRHVQAVAAAPAHSIPQALDYAPSAPPPPAHSIPQALNYDDVARVLGVTVRHVQAVVAAGKLHPIPNLGRLVRFAPTEVFRFMNATPAAVEATPAKHLTGWGQTPVERFICNHLSPNRTGRMDSAPQISATEAAIATAKAEQAALAKQITSLSTAVKPLQGHGTAEGLQSELTGCKAKAFALAKYLTKLTNLRNAEGGIGCM